MFVVMFVLFVFAILCLCLFSFFRSLTKAIRGGGRREVGRRGVNTATKYKKKKENKTRKKKKKKKNRNFWYR